jgi:putative tricarboxylic transport membrane protein
MDIPAALAAGFASALTLTNLGWALVGVTLGTAVGVLPGIGPALTVAVLLPVTFNVDPTSAFIMFGGIYYGAMYGGSTTSILLNTPGETGSIATTIDGYVMAREGRGAAALATAAIGSFVAGTLATVSLTLFAPTLASIALRFGPAEYFALTVVAFTAVSSLLGSSVARGLASLFLGLALGLVGIDPLTGTARFSFGIPQLLDGIDVIILVIGLFAVGETMYQAWGLGTGERGSDGPIDVLPFVSDPRSPIPDPRETRIAGMTRDEWRRSWKPWLRGTAIGFPLGVLPVGGAEIPTFLSYLTEKRLSDRPEQFGKGAIEGVAGPEAANNAAAAGVLVPLLTLGLPASATAAVLLAAFQQYGLQPGPLLFTSRADLVWTLIASLYIGNVMLLVLNLPLVGVWARVMLLPRPLLFGGILVLASLGTYTLNRSMLDLVLLYAAGSIGCAMRVYGFPLVPAVLGLILGPLSEQHFRRALAISEGDLSVFVTRPLAAVLLGMAGAVMLGPRLLRRWKPSTSS